MLKTCSICHKEFHARTEDMDICQDCLDKEFSHASVITEEDQVEFEKETLNNSKRQMKRVLSMNAGYNSGSIFSNTGKLRCCLGVILFLICIGIFVLGDSETNQTPINQLDETSQRIFSMSICFIAACLVMVSFRRHKILVLSAALLMLAGGWFMPSVWHYRGETVKVLTEEEKAKAAEQAAAEEAAAAAKTAAPKPVLTEDDLGPLREAESAAPKLAHYAVYINDQDSATRNVVRDAFTRLLQAGYTRAFSRADGALYIVANVQGKRRSIAGVLDRLGQVTYARPDQGYYEVRFDPEKSNMISRNTSEELTTPTHPSFVSANLRELHCLDVARVRQAANNLKIADVQVLRTDVRDALISVLRESWASEMDTYTALVEALLVYSPQGDAKALDISRRYYQTCRLMNRGTSVNVIKRLIQEDPDSMIDPVIEHWRSNPFAWSGVMDSLGVRAEGKMIKLLEETPDDNIQMIDNIIQFLQRHGSSRSVPAIERFLSHKDQVIRHISQETINELKSRD